MNMFVTVRGEESTGFFVDVVQPGQDSTVSVVDGTMKFNNSEAAFRAASTVAAALGLEAR